MSLMSKKSALALVAVVTLAGGNGAPIAAAQRAGPRHAVPRAQTDDATFAEFKTRLLAAATSGDVDGLIAMMAPSVSHFTEPASPSAVLESYGVVRGRPWIALRDALRIGTDRVRTDAVAPWIRAADVGPNDAVIVADRVRLREGPSDEAPVIRLLSKGEVVTLDESMIYDVDLVERSERPTGARAWARLTTWDNQSGYVFARFLNSWHNSGFGFRRVDGAWKLVSVAAGPD